MFLCSPFGAVKVHGLLGLVVGSNSEGDDLHRGEAGGHGEYLSSMCGFIQILLLRRMRHAGWVSANNVKVCTSNHPCSAVPLHLEDIQADTQPCMVLLTDNNCWLLPTSVGPAYIMGEGKIATMVLDGSRMPSSRTAACCFILQLRGTSSSLVQPPRGWSRRTGFL